MPLSLLLKEDLRSRSDLRNEKDVWRIHALRWNPIGVLMLCMFVLALISVPASAQYIAAHRASAYAAVVTAAMPRAGTP